MIEDKEMKSICFIVCYYGNLPEYFKVWLTSCGKNESINFIVFTDDKYYEEVPSNVSIIQMPFEEVKRRMQAVFDFKICLNSPYKLCDYKPVYGEAFSDYINGYDYWGYCDVDLIWGDIRKFLTDNILNMNQRILTRGHCSVFRNDEITNSLYRSISASGCQNYKDVYTTNENRSFDEWSEHLGWGISEIFRRNKISQYDEKIYLDPDFTKYHLNFQDSNLKDKGKYIVSYEEGKLYAVYKCKEVIQKSEYMYFHFQKRIPDIFINSYEKFLFIPPNNIISAPLEFNIRMIKKWNKIRKIYWFPIRYRISQIIRKIGGK